MVPWASPGSAYRVLGLAVSGVGDHGRQELVHVDIALTVQVAGSNKALKMQQDGQEWTGFCMLGLGLATFAHRVSTAESSLFTTVRYARH